MECWVGGEVASGICRFCGRGLCKAHAKELPFLVVVFQGLKGLEGLAVEGALWCGECRPHPKPVSLDFIDRGAG